MKNRIFLLFLSFLSFQLVAQEDITLESDVMDTRFYETDKMPIIKGKLKNYSPEAFKDLEIKYFLVGLEKRQVAQFTDISADGQFEIKLPYAYAYQEVYIDMGNYYSGKIIAHEEIFIEADLGKLKKKKVRNYGKGIQFKGPDAELNTYFNKFANFKDKEKRKYHKVAQAIFMDTEIKGKERRRKYMEHYQTWDKILNAYIQQYPSKYSTLLKNDSDANFYALLFLTDRQHDMPNELKQKGVKHQPLIVGNAGTFYYKYMTSLFYNLSPTKSVALVKKTLLDKIENTPNYQQFHPFLEQYQLRLERKTYDKAIFTVGDSLFLSPYKDLLKSAMMASFKEKVEQLAPRKADIVKLSGAPEDKWEQQTYYEYMLPSIQTKWVKSLMQQTLQDAIAYTKAVDRTLQKANELTEFSSLGKSTQSFPFGAKLYTSEVTDAQTLIASIQNAFPNKSIILDVWATWCEPCIHDMKNSADTKKAIKALPVEVVYLCVEDGSDQKKWTKTIAELKTAGTHIFLDKKLAESVVKFFDLKGYPSHIFINKKGEWDTNFIHSLAHLDLNKLKKKL